MYRLQLKGVFLLLGVLILTSSCSITSRSMKTPKHHIEFYKNDFEYSKQVSAEASSTRIFMIDWQRLFSWENGATSDDSGTEATQSIAVSSTVVAETFVGVASMLIPVIGDYQKGKVNSYALHKLMKDNPGYDIVLYPQYESKRFVIPFFYSKRHSKVSARLGKIRD